MKKIKSKLYFLAAFGLLAFGFKAMDRLRVVENTSFGPGEHIEYRVHYGIINAAEAIVHVDHKIQKVNNRPCYNVKVVGKTTGAFDLVSKVRDTWQSYIDTSAMIPHQFYTNKREGGYKNIEKVIFDHENEVANRYDLDDKREKNTYKVPKNVQDVVSGYYYLRTIDFSNMKIGQTVLVKAFFEGEILDMRMKYAGKDKIRTKYGTAKVFKINPILPNNSFFEDENSIRIWVSDDANKIPLKIEVDLRIGAISMDIKKFSGLKNQLNFE
ncbi:MAG: DUF3108 domain-containing protein [Bacteroidota bacterium]